MAFTITLTEVFSAAHAVRMPDGVLEPVHGHNWELRVTVGRAELDGTGFVMDFHDLEGQIKALVGPLNNRCLNDVMDLNPTAEHVCLHVARGLRLPREVWLVAVEVTEAPGCAAAYRPGETARPGGPRLGGDVTEGARRGGREGSRESRGEGAGNLR